MGNYSFNANFMIDSNATVLQNVVSSNNVTVLVSGVAYPSGATTIYPSVAERTITGGSVYPSYTPSGATRDLLVAKGATNFRIVDDGTASAYPIYVSGLNSQTFNGSADYTISGNYSITEFYNPNNGSNFLVK
jgi:hypothetical protein